MVAVVSAAPMKRTVVVAYSPVGLRMPASAVRK